MLEKRKQADRAEYIKMAVSRRRKFTREKAIVYKGGKCVLCGYNKCKQALESHHLREGKEFGISAKGCTRKWKDVVKELKKCMLVCANCHREIHSGLTQLPKEILE